VIVVALVVVVSVAAAAIVAAYWRRRRRARARARAAFAELAAGTVALATLCAVVSNADRFAAIVDELGGSLDSILDELEA
jgi:hypothetical protein